MNIHTLVGVGVYIVSARSKFTFTCSISAKKCWHRKISLKQGNAWDLHALTSLAFLLWAPNEQYARLCVRNGTINRVVPKDMCMTFISTGVTNNLYTPTCTCRKRALWLYKHDHKHPLLKEVNTSLSQIIYPTRV